MEASISKENNINPVEQLSRFTPKFTGNLKSRIKRSVFFQFAIVTFLSIASVFYSVSTQFHSYSIIGHYLALALVLLYRKRSYLYLAAFYQTFLYLTVIYLYFNFSLSHVQLFYPHFFAILIYTVFLHLLLQLLKIPELEKRKRVNELNEKFLMRQKAENNQPEALQNIKVKLTDVMFLDTIINLISTNTENIENLAAINARRLREQIGLSHEIVHSTEELNNLFTDIDKNVSIIKSMSEKAIESAMLGKKMADNTEEEIIQIRDIMGKTKDLIKNLSLSTDKISSTIKGIENVANQTNLLAINATIESARAGEEGQSFAVVAEEIGKLAENTQKSARQVISMIESIVDASNNIMEKLPQESQQVNRILENSAGLHIKLGYILNGIENLTDGVHQLHITSRQQSRNSSEIYGYIDSISRFINENAEGVKNIFKLTEVFIDETETLQVITNKFHFRERVDNPTEIFFNLGQEFINEITEIINSAFEKGIMTKEKFFNRNYTEIPGHEPPKYASSYDAFTDEYLSPVQEKYLNRDKRLQYFVLSDNMGYVPTHNQVFSQQHHLEKESALRFNRTKRIYKNEIAQKSIANRKPFLLQMYLKDTGEYVNDLSIPFFWNGEHWGVIRIGFTF